MVKALFILFLCLTLSGCKESSNNNAVNDLKEIVIGEFSSMSGTQGSFGRSSHKGVQLAIDEANEAGGINGVPFKVITIDDKGLIKETEEAVEKLAVEHKALALIGEVASSRTLAAAQVAQKIKIPLISPSATEASITGIGEYIFRACYIDPFQGAAMAQFALKDLKAKTVAVLKDSQSNYSLGLAEHFIKTFETKGGKVIAEDLYSSGDIDFTEQISHFRSLRPDVIYIPGYYNDVGKFAKALRQKGVKTTLIGSDGWDSHRLFEIGKNAVNNSYFTNHFSSQSQLPEAKEFVKKFRKKYGQSPDGLAAMGYDTALLLITALKKIQGPISRESIREALASIKNFNGVTGSISMDKNRNAIKPIVVLKVDGPINRFVTTIKPSEVELPQVIEPDSELKTKSSESSEENKEGSI